MFFTKKNSLPLIHPKWVDIDYDTTEIFIDADKYRLRHIEAQYVARTQLHSGAMKFFFFFWWVSGVCLVVWFARLRLH